MISELISEAPLWLPLLLQSTACLALGLAGSILWRRRAARAHQILLLGLFASVTTPALYASVQYFELGLLAAATTASIELPAPTPPEIDLAAPAVTETTYVALAQEDATPQLATSAPSVSARTPAKEAISIRVPWRVILPAGWIAVSVLLLSRLLFRFGLGMRLLSRADPAEAPSLRSAAEDAQARVGVDANLEIRCSNKVRSPMIWCWRKPPVLLVQPNLDETYETNDLAGVFCHELAHWKRLDHLSGLLAEVMVCLMPWHPLLWWTKRESLKLSEEVCDDWVLASGQTGVDYAESLLALSPQKQMAFVPTVLGKEKAMKERIHRIVSEKCGDPRIGMRWMGTVSVLVLVAIVGVAFAQHRPAEHSRHERHEHREFREQHDLVIAGRRNVLERMLDQLVEQARETEMVLREEGDGLGARGPVLRAELEALREHIEIVERQLRGLQKATQTEHEFHTQDVHVEHDHEMEAHARELARHQDELAEKADLMERELEALGNAQPEKREQIIVELREIHEHMKSMNREHTHLEQERRETEGVRRRTEERELADRLRRDQELITQVRRRLEHLDDPDSETGQALKDKLHQLRAHMIEMEERLANVRRERRGEEEEVHEEEFEAQHDPMAERIRDLEVELEVIHERGEGDGEAARRLRQDLRKVHEEHQKMKHRDTRSAEPDRKPSRAMLETRERRRIAQEQQNAARRDLLRQAHEGLIAQIRMTEDKLKAAREQDSPSADRLLRVLEQLHERRESVEGETRRLGDAPREKPGIEVEVEELRGKVSGMHEEMMQMREMLQQILEQTRRQPSELIELGPLQESSEHR